MKIEHVAWQVADPAAVADWYVKHLGFEVKRRSDGPPCFFLADSTGQVMIEIYNNPAAPVPDYAAQDPLVLHLAFVSDDIPGERRRLLDAGATLVENIETPAGDHVVMMRDPFGLAIQLCQRAEPML